MHYGYIDLIIHKRLHMFMMAGLMFTMSVTPLGKVFA